MPAWGDIVNSLRLNRQKLQSNQLNMMDTAMDVMGKQIAIETQQHLRDAFTGPLLAPPPTGQVATTTGANSDFGSVLDMSDPLTAEYRNTKQMVTDNLRDAAIFKQAGAYQRAESAARLAQEGQNKVDDLVGKLYDKSQTKMKEAMQVLQGVNDQDSLVSAFDYLARNFPPGMVQRLASGMNFSADGLPLYDQNATQSIKALRDQGTTQNEKLTTAQAVTNEAGRNRRADNEVEVKIAGIRAADTRAANAQAGANARFAATYNAKDDKQGTDAEKTASNDLSKNELVKNFPKYAQAFGAAKNVNRQMQSGGIRDTASPDIQDMVRGYEQAINNFRSFMGGKWTAQQTDRMQGALQNVRTYFQTIGQGKKPDQQIVGQIANEVARLYQDTNAAVLKNTLELRERVWKKRGDPTNVISPAQMSEVIRTGRADLMVDPQTGQQMMAFRQSEDYGKDPSKIKPPLSENIVPVYDQPKEDRRKAVVKRGQIVLEEPPEEQE